MKPGLDALIAPGSLRELFACFESSEPFAVHGQRPSITALTEIRLLESLDVLLESWPKMVQAHLPDVADEASSVTVSPDDARKLFDSGMGLLFADVETISPRLTDWLGAIRRDLGLSALTQARCLVYATPRGKGTAPHFDQNVNFVLQVHGTKKWRLAPNSHVERPLTRHTMGLSVDPELQTYARIPMLQRMPEASREIVLQPGSLLFVPRGYWHATSADSDALSLNFTFSAPTWIDVFTAALRGRLAISSEWRKTALPTHVDDFDVLLRDLAHDAAHWNAADILAVTESEPGEPEP